MWCNSAAHIKCESLMAIKGRRCKNVSHSISSNQLPSIPIPNNAEPMAVCQATWINMPSYTKQCISKVRLRFLSFSLLYFSSCHPLCHLPPFSSFWIMLSYLPSFSTIIFCTFFLCQYNPVSLLPSSLWQLLSFHPSHPPLSPRNCLQLWE